MHHRRLRINLLVSFVLIGLLSLVLVLTEGNSDPRTVQVQPTVTLTPDKVVTPTITRTSPKPTSQDEMDWQTYTSQDLGFAVRHPEDVEVQRRQDGSITFIKWGPTQREGTEFYDGIRVQITQGQLGGKSLRAFVEQKVQEEKNDPVTQTVSSIEQVSIGGKIGYKYDISAFGDRTINYLPKGNGEYLRIIDGTIEPKNQGFKQTVKRMLASLRIIQ